MAQHTFMYYLFMYVNYCKSLGHCAAKFKGLNITAYANYLLQAEGTICIGTYA